MPDAASRNAALSCGPRGVLVSNLAGGLAPALVDRKARHRGYAIARISQGIERFDQVGPERADRAGGDDCHAAVFFSVRGVKSQSLGSLIFAIPVAFSTQALYKFPQRKPKLGSWWIVS